MPTPPNRPLMTHSGSRGSPIRDTLYRRLQPFRHLHDASGAEDLRKKRKAFLAKWRPRCLGVADSLEEAGERLFTFLRYHPSHD